MQNQEKMEMSRDMYGNPYMIDNESPMGGCLWIALLLSAIVIFTMLFSSCASKKKVIVEFRDSIRTETKYETIYVTDTLFVEIPPQKGERTTADSVSHLENDYALSDARINADGTLFHSLETKPQSKPVEFQKPVERRDSIVYKEKIVNNTVEVEVEKKLTRWQKIQMNIGTGTIIASVLFIILWIVYKKIKR